MRRKTKDRIVNVVLILLFLTLMGGFGYLIIRKMIHWNVDGLG